jgi:hypothetical protein
MSKYISIDDDVDCFLSKEVPKTEEGKREETWSNQLKRLLKIKKE